MFEEYLFDCYSFYLIAENCSEEKEAKKYYRASAFCAASSIEAFSNYIADTMNKGNSLSKYEISFLLDKRLYLDVDKVELKEITEYHRIEDKLKVYIKKFSKTFNFNSQEWSQFMEFKKFRDRLVHPREMDEDILLKEYKTNIKKGIRSIILIMNVISKSIFKKSLRKRLLDLIP